VLSLVDHRDVGRLPEFKLRLRVAESASASSSGGVEATLCGYVARGFRPGHLYQLVFRRREKYGSGGVLLPYDHDKDDVSEGSVDDKQEERRLIAATETGQT